MILAAGAAMVIDILGHRIDQPPRGVMRAGQFCPHPNPLVELMQTLYRPGEYNALFIQRLCQQVTEKAQRLLRSHRALAKCFSILTEMVPLAYPQPQCLFHGSCVELG